MSEYLDGALETLRAAELELLDELDRLREAIKILAPETLLHQAEKKVNVIKLEAAERPRSRLFREAAADDVLALVATGVERISEIQLHLPATSRVAVIRRLLDLRNEGLIEGPSKDGKWTPTLKARALDWIEFRARELGRKV